MHQEKSGRKKYIVNKHKPINTNPLKHINKKRQIHKTHLKTTSKQKIKETGESQRAVSNKTTLQCVPQSPSHNTVNSVC